MLSTSNLRYCESNYRNCGIFWVLLANSVFSPSVWFLFHSVTRVRVRVSRTSSCQVTHLGPTGHHHCATHTKSSTHRWKGRSVTLRRPTTTVSLHPLESVESKYHSQLPSTCWRGFIEKQSSSLWCECVLNTKL